MKASHLLGVTALLLSTASMAQAQLSTAGEPAHPLTRAEVRADLMMWQRAGLPALVNSDSYDPLDPEVQRRMAEYRRLRNGPEYQAELQRQGGEVRRTVSAPATPDVN